MGEVLTSISTFLWLCICFPIQAFNVTVANFDYEKTGIVKDRDQSDTGLYRA